MSETIASRAILMFWKEPMMWILLRKGQTKNEYARECIRVCEDNARAAGILDGELCLAVLTGYATCCRLLSRDSKEVLREP
jgi:hypothetical protein